MRFKLYIILSAFVALLFAFNNAYSQKQSYNWYFGSNAGISFSPSGSAPNAVTDGMLVSPEGCSAISDSSGNLLFYSDGATIWNRIHQTMQNGSGLNGSANVTQSSIIIPNPQRKNTYYIFTINSATRNLSYSEIDMQRDGGLGAVTVKNTYLISPVAYKLTACLQRNGFDYWVITHGYGNSSYYSISVTGAGVSSTPVITTHGSSIDNQNSFGQMKISPDGSYLAMAMPGAKTVELMEYNNSSGSIGQNGWLLGYKGYSHYGVEFSPDCTKLYISSGNEIVQLDLKQLNNINQDSSYTLIASGSDRFYSVQLAPDGKIYIAQNNSQYLGRINNPNAYGSACSYSGNAVQLQSRNSQKGLPAFVQSWMTRIIVASLVNACEGEDIVLSCSVSRNTESAYFLWSGPNGFSSQEQNPIIKNIKKNQEGYYRVTVTLGSLAFYDSTYVKVESAPKARIIPDGSTTLCQGDSLTLFAQPQGLQYSYHWSTGETGNSIQVTGSGRIFLVVSIGSCRSTDSIDISVVPTFTPAITTLGPKVICEGDSMLLEARPSSGINGYLWSTGDTTQKIVIHKGGSYTVTINKDGCLRSATINILNLPKPQTKIKALGPTSFCIGDSTTLAAEPFDPEYSLLWSTGETSHSIIVRKTGIVTLQVISRNGCSSTDSIEISSGNELKVNINTLPKAPFCDRDSVMLSASPVSFGYTYMWSTGEISNTIFVKNDGTYSVEVTAPGGCKGDDTIDIKFRKSPSAAINKGSNGIICNGDSLLLYPLNYEPGNIYLWSTGQNTPGIYVKLSGNYRLVVTNQSGCSDTAYFSLKVNARPLVKIKSYSGSTLCIGDTVLLIAVSDNPEYKITWSTAETGDSIVVLKSGKYYVFAENSSGCTAVDSVEIKFNPYPQLEILPGNNLTLCEGDTLRLSSKYPYFRYEWNTGEKSGQISVTKPGNYVLTVFDSNGCKSSETVIVKAGENTINGIEDLDFGPYFIWNRTLQKFTFWNYGSDTIKIDTIYTLRNPIVFGLLGTIKPMRLGMSGIADFDAFFYPQDLGVFTDSLVIVVSTPCRETIYVKISGTGIGNTIVGLPDTSALIGTKNFRIPLRAKIKSLNSEIVNLSYTAKIRFYADVFLPVILTNGIIRKDTIIAGERIISIEDDNVVVTQTETVLTEITGTVLLGSHKKTPVKIEDFRWNNKFIEASTRDGSLEAIALCFNDVSLINIAGSMKLKISPNPVTDLLDLNITNPVKGIYDIRINSLTGILLSSEKISVKENNETGEFLYAMSTSGFSAGVYIITVSNENFHYSGLFIRQ